MEENELEEGEACSGQEDDACIDPDVALSYIDEKLQDVLGHFQKDFEGGVSAENLGAKFGGYGSFLPAYQRSPSIWSQPKSPPRPATQNLSRSPYNSSFEVVRQNPSALTSASIPKNNAASAAQYLDSTGKKENSINTTGGIIPQHDSVNKLVNGSDQKTLKVRIKVGPDNGLARNNAAIYSGLGLDYSPSSSPEDSPDGSGGLSSEFRDAPDESPMTILQVMTCFSVPGGYLLSPLPESQLRLTEKQSSFLKSCKAGVFSKDVSEMRVVNKKTKSDEKNGRFMGEQYSNCKDDTGSILKKEIDIGIPAGQKFVSRQSSSVGADVKGDSAKGTCRTLDLSVEPNKTSVRDRISLPDLAKDGQSEINMKGSAVNNSGNEITHSKGKLNSRANMEEKAPEERSTSIHKVTSSDLQREGRDKHQRNFDIIKSDSDGNKVRNDHVAGHAEPVKPMPAQRSTLHEKDGDKMLQGEDQASEGKRKQKGNHALGAASAESTKEQISSAVPKEKNKSSHARGDHSENKSKLLKSHKEMNRGKGKESHSNVNVEKIDSRSDLLEEHFTFNEKSRGRTGVKNMDNVQTSKPLANAPIIAPSTCDAPPSDAAAALPAPVLIEDNWVLCDKCHIWRLLPYGMDTAHLPKKWQCSMQVWLPGLNRCNISEEVTTKAFNDMFLAPVPAPAPDSGTNLNGHHDNAASSITTTDALLIDQRLEHNMQSMPATGKKKHGLVDASNVPNGSSLVKFPSSVKKNPSASVRSRSLNDVNECPSETYSLTKAGPELASKFSNSTSEKHNPKQKEKHKITGDFIEKSGKHSKSKNKREVDQDGFKKSKKIKKESSHYLVEDWHSDFDLAGKPAPSMDNGLSNKTSGKMLQNYCDYSSSKDSKLELKGNVPASIKRSKDPTSVFPNGELKEYSDVEKSVTVDIAAKKRKVKEWKESQGHQESVKSAQHALDNRVIAKEAFSESELRKQKKAKVSKSEVKESTKSVADGKMDKKGRTRILLSGNRNQSSDEMNEEAKVAVGKEQLGLYQGNAASQRSLDGIDSLKRDLGYAQPPTAATSSSSKVSGSRKSKAKFQEARGSPVESVSSSPLRYSNAEVLSTKRNSVGKVDVIPGGPSAIGSPKRCSDGELDGGSDQSGTIKKETTSVQLRSSESRGAAETGVLDSLRGTYDYQDKESNRLSAARAKESMYLKRSTCDDLSPAGFEEANILGASAKPLDQHGKYLHLEKDSHDQDILSNHHCANGSTQQKSDKSSSLCFRERNRSSSSDVDKGKLKVSDSEQELYSAKNGASCQADADFAYHDCSTYQDDSRDCNYSFQEKDEKDFLGKKDFIVKYPTLGRRDNRSSFEVQENLDSHGHSPLSKQHKDYDSKSTFGGTSYPKTNLQSKLQQASSHQNENLRSQFIFDRMDQSEMVSGRGKSQLIQPSKDKHEAQSWGPQTGPTPIKGSRSELYPIDAVNGDASKEFKQSSKPDSQNGVHPNSLRQATLNGPDTSSPIRNNGPAAVHVVLKEARDLKHSANRLKSEGLELESTGLYFEAALKFLHVGSLLEPPSIETAKHGELTPAVNMYSDTARLCEFCAHEYEKCKEMAAAALAYKCVEVAYLKVAYYKHPSATKDRHELQTALQMVLPGESPSSSASDVDNLNNQGTLDKAASAKAVGSPQIVGNHVVAARNRPHFMRLLGYTNDLNCAFEATKRSQNAISAASSSLEKDGVDSMSSVRKVLDFNFHNVEGLLRLVRLALESISG